jgi:hypothetical protein
MTETSITEAANFDRAAIGGCPNPLKCCSNLFCQGRGPAVLLPCSLFPHVPGFSRLPLPLLIQRCLSSWGTKFRAMDPTATQISEMPFVREPHGLRLAVFVLGRVVFLLHARRIELRAVYNILI